MNVDIVHASIERFLRLRIDKKIEAEKKKLKDDFTADHLSKIHSDHEIVSWMDYIADNASKVSLNVSHVAKLTHSSNKAINLIDSIPQIKYQYLLTTQTAKVSDFDNAYTSSSYAPVADFLNFDVADTSKKLGRFLAENEIYFCKISDDVKVRENWRSKIAEAYTAKKLASHVLAKQIYCPVEKDFYHILSPIKSSSLAHLIFKKVEYSRSDENEVKQSYHAKKLHEDTYIYYSEVASLKTTNSKHLNVSLLNETRGGRLYFFQANPPQWREKILPPNSINKFLKYCETSVVLQIFKEIKNLLLVLKRENLTINLNRRNILGEKVGAIADEVIHQILFIEQSYLSGWSKDYDLEPYLRAFLDPNPQCNISKMEYKEYIDEFTEQIAKWISKNIGDKHESRQLKAIWFSFLHPIFSEFYEVLQVSE